LETIFTEKQYILYSIVDTRQKKYPETRARQNYYTRLYTGLIVVASTIVSFNNK